MVRHVLTDYPHVRSLTTCPRCHNPKDTGLLFCWPCHHILKECYHGSYGLRMERVLADTEHKLAAATRAAERFT